MRARLVSSSLVTGIVVLGACNASESLTVCTREARPGIVLEVRDSLTGAPAASGALAIAQAAAFADTLRGTDLFLSGALERPGRYDVTVTKSGYRPWAAANVQVTQGLCHVETVTVQARLVPA